MAFGSLSEILDPLEHQRQHGRNGWVAQANEFFDGLNIVFGRDQWKLNAAHVWHLLGKDMNAGSSAEGKVLSVWANVEVRIDARHGRTRKTIFHLAGAGR